MLFLYGDIMKYVLYGEGEEGDNSIHTGFVSRIGVYIVTGALAVATGCATPSQSRTKGPIRRPYNRRIRWWPVHCYDVCVSSFNVLLS